MIAPAHARAADEAEATVAEAEAASGAMVDSWNIVQNATKSPEHKTLVQALTAAGLTETLSGAGPFTVFAPTDQAFAAVPQPMTAYLMDPVNKPALAQVLTYHVVPGAITSADLYAKIKAGGGKATLTTVEGQPLTFTEVSGNIKVDGTQGSSGYVTQADVAQSNGMIHILNGVLIPEIKPAAAAEPVAAPAEAAPAAAATPAS
ncbi:MULTISPECIES: fasciclin domain-containing protein [unclassified Sphingopyxis]|uniref:fasciclin domain-containing protein n=1 Tax=unclassified Sphingopyxis TaxID=2614943 RepID=UPI0028571745|nr:MULTISPECIES: fasciclin domain-containing protein [unclassified Sphingopyxis]MDR6835035.1 putative surface protein with fasciclin (FAS1) repeats [Sphingopyxis sp. BE122]MDR7227306.1 putative surface protein with fasciclin (FAS1) repeats [Sphingopyxis sp. BE259]